MTVPKIPTVSHGGSRFYVDPNDARHKVIGVTSVLNQIAKQQFLGPWQAKLTAECAVDDLDVWGPLAKRDRAGAVDFLKRAPGRSTQGSADRGTRVHEMIEHVLTDGLVELDDELRPFYDAFIEFLTATQAKAVLVEQTVWNDTLGYAGSFDAVLEIDGQNIIVDWKTSRSIYPETALQLCAYANADGVMHADGTITDLPEIHGAAVLHLADAGKSIKWSFVPLSIDGLMPFFTALIKATEWAAAISQTVVGRPIAGGVVSKVSTTTTTQTGQEVSA